LLAFFAEKYKKHVNRGSRLVFVLIGITLVASMSCAPATRKREKRPLSAESVRALRDFEKAEQLSEQRSYQEALAIYQDYLERFPEGGVADKALMKSGLIHMAIGNYLQARTVFERLLSDYRKSPFWDDARYSLILTYYTEGDYESAVAFGKSALPSAKTPAQKFRLNKLLGYALSANSQFEGAIFHFMEAFNLGSQQERTEILSTVKEVITYLKVEELEALISRFKDRVPGGYLRLQLAREYAAEDRIDEAVEVLSEFMEVFPEHDDMQVAMALMEEMKSRASVDPFLIGCILPLSGPYGTFGNRALTGIELALDQINRRPDTYPVQLSIRDSKGDPNEAMAALESLVMQDGVIGILGPMITAEPVALRAQALRVPIMTLTQKTNITATGDYVFRNFLTASLQVKSIVDYAVNDLGMERFAIFYPDEPYGISFMNQFWDELMRHDAEVVGIESYAPDQTDFKDAIRKLVGLYHPRMEEPPGDVSDGGTWEKFLQYEQDQVRWAESGEPGVFVDDAATDQDEGEGDAEEEEKPRAIVDFEAIFIPDSYDKVGLITPQLLFHDVEDVLLLGSNLWHSERLIKMAGRYVQGAVVPDGFFVDSIFPEVQDFVDSYEEVFGRSPEFLEAQAFDGAMILFEAVNSPDVRSRRSLMMALMGLRDFPGVTGRTSFNETGDVEKELYLLSVEGRRFVQIRP
jgi:ABC-type branched-subunit amino acid transport system substrate-binding protein/Flp pilus assembly protein TadD